MRIKEVGDLLPDDALMTHAAPAGGLYIICSIPKHDVCRYNTYVGML